MATIIFEESLEIPDGIDDLSDFRHWLHSDNFPRRGRIDYIGGRIEVQLSHAE